jgi:cytidylate kinase
MIIAIDGPAGSGKSTIAREVAKKLGMRYLDTGAMYRAVTLLALEAGLVPDRLGEAGKVAAGASLRLEERKNDLSRVFVGAREVSDQIRGPLVSRNVSAVSAEPAVREILTQQQREEARKGNVVLEGRDMGTVVVPDAEVKVFLTASLRERAQRRQLQLKGQGVSQSLEQLMEDIKARDALDSGREVAPLLKASDAVEIDTTGMSIPEVVATVCSLANTSPRETKPRESEKAAVKRVREYRVGLMRRGPRDTALYHATHVVLGPLWRFVYRMKVKGVEHVPLTGPVILACNHRAMTDPFFMGINVPRQIHYMAKSELWKFRFLGWAMEAFGTFPVNRGEADRAAIKAGMEILDAGAVLGLFPEGHVNKNEGLGPLRSGISLFSLREGVVTVPAVLRGTNRAFRRGIPRFPRVELVIGPPLEMPSPQVPRSERGRLVTELVAEALNTLLATSADK